MDCCIVEFSNVFLWRICDNKPSQFEQTRNCLCDWDHHWIVNAQTTLWSPHLYETALQLRLYQLKHLFSVCCVCPQAPVMDVSQRGFSLSSASRSWWQWAGQNSSRCLAQRRRVSKSTTITTACTALDCLCLPSTLKTATQVGSCFWLNEMDSCSLLQYIYLNELPFCRQRLCILSYSGTPFCPLLQIWQRCPRSQSGAVHLQQTIWRSWSKPSCPGCLDALTLCPRNLRIAVAAQNLFWVGAQQSFSLPFTFEADILLADEYKNYVFLNCDDSKIGISADNYVR